MLRQTFKVGVRTLFRNKLFTSINIIGLSIGIASSILILLLIQELLSVDQFHEKKDRIYLVYNKIKGNDGIQTFSGSSSLLAPYIKSNFSQFEDAVRVHNVGNFIFHNGEKHLEGGGILTDAGFLTTFTFPLLKGDPKTALRDPHALVVTETFAKKLFGTEDPMGKLVRVDSTALFTVTGIVKDPPTHSMISFDYLMPYTYRKEVNWDILRWDDYSVLTYLLLKPGINQHSGNSLVRDIAKLNGNVLSELFIHPLSRVYLYGRFENGKESGGGIDFIYRIGLIGAFILLIACINYVNLSTARSVLRSREVGIRKVVGAGRFSLVVQYVGESVLVAAIAAAVGLAIAQVCLNFFNQLVFTRFAIPYSSGYFWGSGILLVIITGIISGIYPAFVLSGYNPVTVLKGVVKSSHSTISLRKMLVVIQFGFAIVFIICTIVVYRQIDLGRNLKVGYDQSNLAYIYQRGDLPKYYERIKNELYETGAITSVTRTNSPITMVWSRSNDVEWQGKNPTFKPDIAEFHSDKDFVKTMGASIIVGRDIDPEKFPTDSTAVLLNQAAVDMMGFNNPVGQIIRSGGVDWRVVGVVNNFVVENPYAPVAPTVIQGPRNWLGTVTFRLNPASPASTNLRKINAVLTKYNPDYPANFVFVDEDHQLKFSGSKSLGKLALLFAGLSILISCLGLYALAMYMVTTRVKEIGIRKVLGATTVQITTLLSRDFVQLVLIAFLIASPVAWWILNSWLQDFTYRVSIGWWTFALSAIIPVIIAFATVSYQSIKSALSHPVKALRTE